MGYLDRGERAGKVVRCLECDVCCCCGKKTVEWEQNDLSDTSVWLIVTGTKQRGPGARAAKLQHHLY